MASPYERVALPSLGHGSPFVFRSDADPQVNSDRLVTPSRPSRPETESVRRSAVCGLSVQ
jgi:hypothetical protein